jgi:hypothetical protein
MLLNDGITGNKTTRIINNLHVCSFASNEYNGSYPSFTTNVVLRSNGDSYLNGGSVGIGTTSPNDKLEVSGGNIRIYSTNNANHLILKNNATGTSGLFEERIKFLGWNDNENAAIIGMGNAYFGSPVNVLAFQVSGSEKMRITHAGHIQTNLMTSSGSSLSYGLQIIKQLDYSQFYISSNNSSTRNIQRFYNPNGNIGNITMSQSSVTYSTTSDYRLKEDLQDFKGLDMVSKIPVYDFKWKTDESRSYGVMAHELQEVLPDAVTGEKDAEEMQGVDYSKIVPLLVKSIQELKADNDSLKARIETLENN